MLKRHAPHLKFIVPGRSIPTEKMVCEFSQAVEGALTATPTGCVAVHCTHGVNRTGYKPYPCPLPKPCCGGLLRDGYCQ